MDLDIELISMYLLIVIEILISTSNGKECEKRIYKMNHSAVHLKQTKCCS